MQQTQQDNRIRPHVAESVTSTVEKRVLMEVPGQCSMGPPDTQDQQQGPLPSDSPAGRSPPRDALDLVLEAAQKLLSQDETGAMGNPGTSVQGGRLLGEIEAYLGHKGRRGMEGMHALISSLTSHRGSGMPPNAAKHSMAPPHGPDTGASSAPCPKGAQTYSCPRQTAREQLFRNVKTCGLWQPAQAAADDGYTSCVPALEVPVGKTKVLLQSLGGAGRAERDTGAAAAWDSGEGGAEAARASGCGSRDASASPKTQGSPAGAPQRHKANAEATPEAARPIPGTNPRKDRLLFSQSAQKGPLDAEVTILGIPFHSGFRPRDGMGSWQLNQDALQPLLSTEQGCGPHGSHEVGGATPFPSLWGPHGPCLEAALQAGLGRGWEKGALAPGISLAQPTLNGDGNGTSGAQCAPGEQGQAVVGAAYHDVLSLAFDLDRRRRGLPVTAAAATQLSPGPMHELPVTEGLDTLHKGLVTNKSVAAVLPGPVNGIPAAEALVRLADKVVLPAAAGRVQTGEAGRTQSCLSRGEVARRPGSSRNQQDAPCHQLERKRSRTAVQPTLGLPAAAAGAAHVEAVLPSAHGGTGPLPWVPAASPLSAFHVSGAFAAPDYALHQGGLADGMPAVIPAPRAAAAAVAPSLCSAAQRLNRGYSEGYSEGSGKAAESFSSVNEGEEDGTHSLWRAGADQGSLFESAAFRSPEAFLMDRLGQAATALDRNDQMLFRRRFEWLCQMADPDGLSIQRLLHYELHALFVRCVGAGAAAYSAPSDRPPQEVGCSMAWFFNASPWPRFAVAATVATLCTVLAGQPRVHLVEFGTRLAGPWCNLIRALVALSPRRADGTPNLHVRITQMDMTLFTNPGRMDLKRQQQSPSELKAVLATCAASCGVELEHELVELGQDAMHNLHCVRRRPGEMLVCSVVALLDYEPGWGVKHPGCREVLIKWIGSMGPTVFTMFGYNLDSTLPFLPRFKRHLTHHLSLLRGNEVACAPGDEHLRRTFEETYNAVQRINMVACEGADRVLRPLLFESWATLFARVGIVPAVLPDAAVSSIHSMFKAFPPEFGFLVEKNVVRINLDGTSGIYFSVWQPQPERRSAGLQGYGI